MLPLGVLYLWLAYQATKNLDPGDLVSYVILLMFLVLGVGAAAAGINIARTKRR